MIIIFKWLVSEINNIAEKDPAVRYKIEVFLYPSLHAIINHKIAHFFQKHKLYFLARSFAIVLFPLPAGPSIATIKFFIFHLLFIKNLGK